MNATNAGPGWVTFDCFGTLIDWNSGFLALLAPLAGPRTAELISAYHRREREVEAARPHQLYRFVLTEALFQGARDIGLPLARVQLGELPLRWGEMKVFPDVEDALAGLRAAGWKLAVLTNCDDDLFAQTHRAFRHPFDLVITAEQVQSYKPAPGHFRRFAALTGANASNWIHVACSWFHDIEPTCRIGIPRIWVDRDRTGHDAAAATVRIEDANALEEAVDVIATRV